MKILVIGHSMVHSRQQYFFKKLGKLVGFCIIVGPASWGNLKLKDTANKTYSSVGLITTNEGDIFQYELVGLEEIIEEIKPDIIYCQAELRAIQTLRSLYAAKANNIPFVVFLWENIFKPVSVQELEILSESSLIICGNSEAKHLLPEEVRVKCYILPQVGIELDYFKPYIDAEKKYDIVFCGRPVTEKGIDIITEGCRELNCSLSIIQGQEYEKIPRLLCEGKIFVSLPITTSTWKEQSGSYTNLEAMACGLPVITTRCGAIPEYLGNAAAYCEENNLRSFIECLKTMLFQNETYIDNGLNTARTFSNEIIASRLLEILKKCI